MIHRDFDEILAAATKALGAPTSDGKSASGARRLAWGHGAVVMIAMPHAVYFVHQRSWGTWWVVDDIGHGPTVPLADALAALKGLR